MQSVALDVTDPASVAARSTRRPQRSARSPSSINNAGIAITKPLLEHTEEDWQQVIDVNLNGAWRVAQAAARHMVTDAQGGSIVNIASILGLRVAAQVPSYAASKAALVHLTKAMALELARYRIRVNALAPGYVETALNRDFFASEAGEAMIKRVPQRRIGTPEELDGALLLLASDAGSYIDGRRARRRRRPSGEYAMTRSRGGRVRLCVNCAAARSRRRGPRSGPAGSSSPIVQRAVTARPDSSG